MVDKRKQKKPHRQIELHREVDKGWEGMSGRTEVILNFEDSAALKVGNDFYAKALSEPEKPWVIRWVAAQTENYEI